MELAPAAATTVQRLSVDQKQALIEEWKRVPRLVALSNEEAIIERYAMVVLGVVISRARTAGARTSNWE